MSGSALGITNPFATVKYDPMAVDQAVQAQQRNKLYIEQQQQQVSQADVEQTARSAAGLLNMSETDAAAAYPDWLAGMRARGLARYAPDTYPGHARATQLVTQGLPIKEQYELGLVTSPELRAALAGVMGPPPGGGTGTTGGAALPRTAYGEGGPGASLTVPPAYMSYYEAASKKYGIPVDVLIAQHRQESGFNAAARGKAGEIGLGQVMPSTARQPGFGMAGVDPQTLWNPEANIDFSAAYLAARAGKIDWNNPEQVARALHAYNAGGDAEYVAHVTRYLPKPGGTQTAAAAPQAAPGGGAMPPPYQVASVGPTPSPPTPGGAPDVPAPAAAGTVPTQQAAAAPSPLPPQPLAPPAPAAAPPVQPAAAPATGINSPQFQKAQALLQQAARLEMMPGAAVNPQVKASVAYLKSQAAMMMQADSVTIGPGGVQTKAISGEQVSAAKPLSNWVYDKDNGVWRDTTGGAQPYRPPPGALRMQEGVGMVMTMPDGTAKVVSPIDLEGMARQRAAEAGGTQIGQQSAKLVTQLAETGRNATQAIGNIDYGINQLNEAAKAGIPSGYFSPALATAAAMAKSLGINLSALGIDPKAVGNVQSAQKTLGVVAGAILQQAIGKDSQITDAKIEHFIHTQPGLETDPDAIKRVLNWARSQFVYENELARAAMRDSKDTGILPAGWQSRYFDEHGFAPIYNPGSGEMQQPEGQAPPREPPAAATTAPVNPAAREVGKTYQTPKGELKWTGTGWAPK